MRFGCCVSADQIDVIAEAGYDFCELPARAVLPFADDAEALAPLRAIAAAPLRPEAFNVLIPAELPMVVPSADLAALRTYLRRAFGRMVQLGGEVAVLGSGAARRIPEGMPRDQALDQLAAALALARDEAARAGVALALEHLNRGETNVFNTLAECRAFIEERNLTGLRLQVDVYHLELEHEPFSEIVACAPLLVHAHIAGGDRRAPDVPGSNSAGYMAALHTAGYDRRISAECRWEDLAAQAPTSLAFMRQAWREAASEAPSGAPAR